MLFERTSRPAECGYFIYALNRIWIMTYMVQSPLLALQLRCIEQVESMCRRLHRECRETQHLDIETRGKRSRSEQLCREHPLRPRKNQTYDEARRARIQSNKVTINSLPDECLLLILQKLSLRELVSSACRVCRRWRAVGRDVSLWREVELVWCRGSAAVGWEVSVAPCLAVFRIDLSTCFALRSGPACTQIVEHVPSDIRKLCISFDAVHFDAVLSLLAKTKDQLRELVLHQTQLQWDWMNILHSEQSLLMDVRRIETFWETVTTSRITSIKMRVPQLFTNADIDFSGVSVPSLQRLICVLDESKRGRTWLEVTRQGMMMSGTLASLIRAHSSTLVAVQVPWIPTEENRCAAVYEALGRCAGLRFASVPLQAPAASHLCSLRSLQKLRLYGTACDAGPHVARLTASEDFARLVALPSTVILWLLDGEAHRTVFSSLSGLRNVRALTLRRCKIPSPASGSLGGLGPLPSLEKLVVRQVASVVPFCLLCITRRNLPCLRELHICGSLVCDEDYCLSAVIADLRGVIPNLVVPPFSCSCQK